jgi:hypothetical protein
MIAEYIMALGLLVVVMCSFCYLYGHAVAEVRFETQLRKSYEEIEDLYSVIHSFRAGISSAGAAHPSGSRPDYLKPVS